MLISHLAEADFFTPIQGFILIFGKMYSYMIQGIIPLSQIAESEDICSVLVFQCQKKSSIDNWIDNGSVFFLFLHFSVSGLL